MAEHHAYLGLMLDLARTGARRFDIVHNNSLHHLPVAMAAMLSVPMVTTLHTPPIPWLESAIATAARGGPFAAVSGTPPGPGRTRSRAPPSPTGWTSTPGRPGRAADRPCGPGGWCPEKAPHEAIDAAREAGVPLVLAGPTSDRAYFDAQVAPRLGPDVDVRRAPRPPRRWPRCSARPASRS